MIYNPYWYLIIIECYKQDSTINFYYRLSLFAVPLVKFNPQ